jgi:hypothetical protein
MRIICLANSYKHNGRCIAGLDSRGKWIRPVSSSKKRAISKESRLIGGTEPQILDIVEVPVHVNGPTDGCQPENKLLKSGLWKRVGRVKPEELLRYCEDDSKILHNNLDHVRASCFRMIPGYGWKSLQLIHNDNIDFEPDENNKTKWRAKFTNSKGIDLSLRITDPVICQRLDRGEKINKDCLLTVSMAPGWSPDKKTPKKCYKFVAGVVEFGTSVQK